MNQATVMNINLIENSDQFHEVLDQISSAEKGVNDELASLLSEDFDLAAKLEGLRQTEWNSVELDVQNVTALISNTARLASAITSKVCQLDLIKTRVLECQQRVNDLIDLRICSDGVKDALLDEDYEKAAAHVHRFLFMDEGLLKLTATEIRPDSVSGLDAMLQTLHSAETQVKDVISKKFDEAVDREDLASVERFFKLFPLVKLHEVGLCKFVEYLCTKIKIASKKNLKEALERPISDSRSAVIFADTITLLFEGIARTVEIHQPLIETYYGPGHLSFVVLLLQKECDKRSIYVINEFKKRRKLDDKIKAVKSSTNFAANNMNSSSSLDVTELDPLLGEMSVLQARSEVYFRFLRKRVSIDFDVHLVDEALRRKKICQFDTSIDASELCRNVQQILSDYIFLEQYFMEDNFRKAIEGQSKSSILEDEQPGDYLSLVLLDDVFFVLKKCVRRSMSTHNVDGFCAILNNACTLLETQLHNIIDSQLRKGFPSGIMEFANAIQSSFQQGKLLAANDLEKNKTNFLMHFNGATDASEYIKTLKLSLEAEFASSTFVGVGTGGETISLRRSRDKEKALTCLAGLDLAAAKFSSLHNFGIKQLRLSLVRPRLKPVIDSFLSVTNHDILEEEEFTKNETDDLFVQTLLRCLDGLLSSLKSSLSSSNYSSLVSIVSSEVAIQIEAIINKATFSRLGGLQFDRELRSIVNFLTAAANSWTIREKFVRLTQISTLLNLETPNELYDVRPNSSASNGILSSLEVRQIMSLRSDFKQEDIKRLRL